MEETTQQGVYADSFFLIERTWHSLMVILSAYGALLMLRLRFPQQVVLLQPWECLDRLLAPEI